MHCVGRVQTFSVKPGDNCSLLTGKLKGLKCLLRISVKNPLILALNCKPMRDQDTVDHSENS